MPSDHRYEPLKAQHYSESEFLKKRWLIDHALVSGLCKKHNEIYELLNPQHMRIGIRGL